MLSFFQQVYSNAFYIFFIVLDFILFLYELHTVMLHFTFYLQTQTYHYPQIQGIILKIKIQILKW